MQEKSETSATEMRQFIHNQDPQKEQSAVQPPQVSQPHQHGAPQQYAPVPGVTQGIPQGMQMVPGQPIQYQYQGQPGGYGGLPNPLNQILQHNQNQLQAVQKVPGPDVMNNLTQIMIRQMPQFMEAFTDCEFENIYYIHTYEGGQKGKKIFKGRERSTCVARHCIGPACRPFNMFVTKKKNLGKGAFLRFERNYAYTCCCCNRPYMQVYNIEESMIGVGNKLLRPSQQDQLIGRVHDPFHCCDLTFNCFNESGQKDYFIHGSCCQCGIFCHCPCGPCKRVNFTIKDKNGEEVGSIEKVWNSCVRDMITNADTYIANFPAQATWKQKAVILAATIMIDFRHFEEKKNNRH